MCAAAPPASPDLEGVQSALAANADPDSADPSGTTALHWSSHHGHEEVVAALLKAGADANMVHGTFGHSALHCARSVAVAEMLLAADANPHLCDNQGTTGARFGSPHQTWHCSSPSFGLC
jgi:ankyrin repeat protein